MKAIENVNIFTPTTARPVVLDDVGLVFINEGPGFPLPRSQHEIRALNTICLLPPNGFSYLRGEKVNIAGFGDKGVVTALPNLLTQTEQLIQSETYCKSQQPAFSFQSRFCYFDPTLTAAQPCGGDSGAPAVASFTVTGEVLDPGLSYQRAYAVGINVWKRGACGYSDLFLLKSGFRDPAYGMRVDYYRPWINQVIGEHLRAKPCLGCPIS